MELANNRFLKQVCGVLGNIAVVHASQHRQPVVHIAVKPDVDGLLFEAHPALPFFLAEAQCWRWSGKDIRAAAA
jgi:hypothetical protein